jgi:hypothetical protein
LRGTGAVMFGRPCTVLRPCAVGQDGALPCLSMCGWNSRTSATRRGNWFVTQEDERRVLGRARALPRQAHRDRGGVQIRIWRENLLQLDVVITVIARGVSGGGTLLACPWGLRAAGSDAGVMSVRWDSRAGPGPARW